MRAVLDVNVLISAVLARDGAPARILSRWAAGAFELVVSRKLLQELERALAYPKIRARISAGEAAAFVALLRDAAAELHDDPRDPAPRSPDHGDDYLLALAEAADVVLVSGDQHVLGLAPDLPVMSPRAFLDELESRQLPGVE